MSLINRLAVTRSREGAFWGAAGLAATVAVAGLWLWLYSPLGSYLAVIFSRQDFRTNQLLLLGILLLIARQLKEEGARVRLPAWPRPERLPLALALGGSLLYLAAERTLDINTLSATLGILSTYGLLGLWLPGARWRAGLPAALLLIGVLPFGHHLQTFVGYPMRILTAAIVRDGLAAAGVGTVGIDTILVFENGVSQVDLPCSGVKSLWTGSLFLLSATWLERRPLGWRWLGTALFLALLLFLTNLARVAILVVTGPLLGWQLAAEMLHVPLGVLGFALACAAAVWLLRQQPAEAAVPASGPLWLPPALMLAIALMALAYTPRPQTGLSQPPPPWRFPAGLRTEADPLSPRELAWLVRDGAESAERRHFSWGDLSGSFILITSSTWRSHHRPERCFEVYGLSLEHSYTHLVAPELPVRFVSLGAGDRHNLLSATYWLQSAGHTTDDYGRRIWADLAPVRERWVLVSILFDGAVDPSRPEVQAFYLALHQAVAASLEPAGPQAPTGSRDRWPAPGGRS